MQGGDAGDRAKRVVWRKTHTGILGHGRDLFRLRQPAGMADVRLRDVEGALA